LQRAEAECCFQAVENVTFDGLVSEIGSAWSYGGAISVFNCIGFPNGVGHHLDLCRDAIRIEARPK